MALDRHAAGRDRRPHRPARHRPLDGSGSASAPAFRKKPLTTMREALGELRDRARRACGSCSPRWGRRCARSPARDYDGVFFNWMTPGVRRLGARRTSRPAPARPRASTPPVFGYVRTAVGEDAARAAGQGGVLLPRPPRRLPQPLRPPRRARGHRRRRRRRHATRPRRRSAATTALDVTVVRGLASANVEAMTAVAEAAASVNQRPGPCSGRSRSPSPDWRLATGASAANPSRRWLTRAAGSPTPSGRVVILHGVNMVYKVGSYAPGRRGLRRRRRALPAAPTASTRSGSGSSTRASSRTRRRRASPVTDARYLRSIARDRVGARPRSGIFSLLDFHQDLYNERFQGEGWPDWQVLDDGVPSEPQAGFPGNYS